MVTNFCDFTSQISGGDPSQDKKPSPHHRARWNLFTTYGGPRNWLPLPNDTTCKEGAKSSVGTRSR